jgi:hypothetical protein
MLRYHKQKDFHNKFSKINVADYNLYQVWQDIIGIQCSGFTCISMNTNTSINMKI